MESLGGKIKSIILIIIIKKKIKISKSAGLLSLSGNFKQDVP